jgi:AcrR family transcriptional regulator
MGKKRRLNRDVVVATAIDLANAAGTYEAVTLSALAAALEVRTPSLYNHVQGLEGLRRDMALEGVRRLTATFRDAAVGRTGRSALRAVADAYRAFALANPGLYPLTQRGPETGDAELQAAAAEVVGVGLAVLHSCGLTGDDALHAVRGLRSVVHGFVSLETGGGFRLDLDPTESFHRLVEAFGAGLAPAP